MRDVFFPSYISMCMNCFKDYADECDIYAGPGVGGEYGPYRQSERNFLYKQYAEKLLESGHVYRCFCSNEVTMFELQIFDSSLVTCSIME